MQRFRLTEKKIALCVSPKTQVVTARSNFCSVTSNSRLPTGVGFERQGGSFARLTAIGVVDPEFLAPQVRHRKCCRPIGRSVGYSSEFQCGTSKMVSSAARNPSIC